MQLYITSSWMFFGNRHNKLSRREDRYTWRHNNVLLCIYQVVKAQLAEVNKRAVVNEGKQPLPFVPAVKLRGALNVKRNNLQSVYFEVRMIGHATLIYLSAAPQVRLMYSPMMSVPPQRRSTAISSLGKGGSVLGLN